MKDDDASATRTFSFGGAIFTDSSKCGLTPLQSVPQVWRVIGAV
jgi:hypothetical protein